MGCFPSREPLQGQGLRRGTVAHHSARGPWLSALLRGTGDRSTHPTPAEEGEVVEFFGRYRPSTYGEYMVSDG